MLVFQNETMEEISSHAQTEYPRECCGIMLGKRWDDRRVVSSVIHTRNVLDEEKKHTQFLINPLELVRIEVLAEKEGLEIVGFYHSHPDYPAVVSASDIDHMIKGYSYTIVSVKNRKCVKVSSFEKEVQTDANAKEEILVKEK